jgi:hypothetical protein
MERFGTCVERHTDKKMRLPFGSNKGWNVWNALERQKCVSASTLQFKLTGLGA